MTTKDLEITSQSVKGTSLNSLYNLSFSNIPHAKMLAELFGAEAYARSFYGEELLKARMPLIPHTEARYLSTNALIKASGISQVLELAAGRSPRCLEGRTLRYIYTDYDYETLKRMEETARGMLDKRRMPLFLRLDAVTGDGLEDVQRRLRKDPITVIGEGLLTYYPKEEKAKIVRNVRKILEAHKGVYITPDVASKETSELYKKLKIDYDAIQAIRQQNTGRDRQSYLFESTDDAAGFMESEGFSVEVHKMGDLFTGLYSARVLFQDEDRAEEIADTYRQFPIFKMSLR